MNGKYWDITATAFRGCSHVSRGCDNCWAEKFAGRHINNPKTQALYAGLAGPGGWTGKTRYRADWDKGMWLPREPKKILFNAMGDLFHEVNRPADIQDCLAKISGLKKHIFIIPTKRPEVAVYHLNIARWGLDNVWLLASVEDQEAADLRVPWLLKCRPRVGLVGLSVEPMLGAIDLTKYPPFSNKCEFIGTEKNNGDVMVHELKIGWVVCGGENGPAARPMHPDAARGLRDQCGRLGVPFFFKQWGEYRGYMRLGHKLTGRELDGAEHNGVPV